MRPKPLFDPDRYLPAPDGTEIDPFGNPADSRGAELPGMPEGLGVSAGRIRAGVTSAIHVHPVVTQYTYVAAGRLTVRMREPGEDAPREFPLAYGEAVRTDPGVPVQFANDTDADVHVLYITSPPYASVRETAPVVYEDAVLLDDWLPGLSDEDRERAAVEREEALRRLTPHG